MISLPPFVSLNFEIQEGKGDLRNYIVSLGLKLKDDIACEPVMVFDREGYGTSFFHTLIGTQARFVTWEKHIDREKLEALSAGRFNEGFVFNGKTCRVFEDEKLLPIHLKMALPQHSA